jgi:PmbA protein
MTEKPLLTTAREGIAWLKKQAPKAEAELFLSRGREAGVEFKEGLPESVQESRHEGTGLRLIVDGRQGFAYATGAGLEIVQDLYSRIERHLPSLEKDERRRLPRPSEFDAPAESPELRKSLLDPTVLQTPLPERTELLRKMEERALSLDKRIVKVLRSGVGEGRGEVAIASTQGVECVEEGTHCSLGLAVTAGEGTEVQVGSASDSRRFAADLDWKRLADDAVLRTVCLLDAKKLPTKRRAVLFDPWVAGELLDLLTGSLSADQIQHGKSMLKDKLGKKIASDTVSFIDDGRLPKGAASSMFDDEGVPTRRKAMIENGVLKEFFYDSYTGARADRKSNGSGSRPSFRGLPRPGHSNFFLEPGKMTRDQLIQDTPDGVLVFELLGMHTANPISGEFSVGLSGIAIENGKLTHGVRGAMVAGSLLECLQNVDAIASDLTFYGSIGTPTFRVQGLTVA